MEMWLARRLADEDGALDISIAGVALAAALIGIQACISFRLQLGLHSQLAAAAVRCVVQLSVLGYILVPIFRLNKLWLVLAYASFMVWISAVEATSRPSKTYQGMFLTTLLIIGLCAGSIMGYALLLVIGVQPWWSAQYLIPILGMVLGNTISGISIGLTAVIEELTTGADRIERLLALGAGRSEATRDLLYRSVRLAMTPLLNQMSVVGLVSIPGMMTGQILGGTNPDQAARYQMVIMFLLGAASTAAAVASTAAAVNNVLDNCHRLRLERLVPRARGAGVNGFITEAALQIWRGLAWTARTIICCGCCSRHRARQPSTDAAAGGDEAKQPLLASCHSDTPHGDGDTQQQQQGGDAVVLPVSTPASAGSALLARTGSGCTTTSEARGVPADGSRCMEVQIDPQSSVSSSWAAAAPAPAPIGLAAGVAVGLESKAAAAAGPSSGGPAAAAPDATSSPASFSCTSSSSSRLAPAVAAVAAMAAATAEDAAIQAASATKERA